MRYYKEIRFRLLPEEKAALVALSEEDNMSQSAYVRRLILLEARKRGLWSAPQKRVSAAGRNDRMRKKIRAIG